MVPVRKERSFHALENSRDADPRMVCMEESHRARTSAGRYVESGKNLPDLAHCRDLLAGQY